MRAWNLHRDHGQQLCCSHIKIMSMEPFPGNILDVGIFVPHDRLEAVLASVFERLIHLAESQPNEFVISKFATKL